jgi:Domain of unknown function (DU1801)
MKSKATTIQQYLDGLPVDRRTALEAVRKVVLANLPAGYEEGMLFGMIGYYVPLTRFPKTYNSQPLQYAALASQKNYMALYMTHVWADPEVRDWFESEFRKTGKKLDMGKSCLLFRRLDDLPLDVIGEAIARTSPDEFIGMFDDARKRPVAGPRRKDKS